MPERVGFGGFTFFVGLLGFFGFLAQSGCSIRSSRAWYKIADQTVKRTRTALHRDPAPSLHGRSRSTAARRDEPSPRRTPPRALLRPSRGTLVPDTGFGCQAPTTGVPRVCSVPFGKALQTLPRLWTASAREPCDF